MAKDLVEVIKQNPGGTFVIDNDCWWYVAAKQSDAGDPIYLAEDGEVTKRGDGGYGSGNCYGGDVLQALAEIVGVKVQSV